jgi:hypothetical protein
MGNLNSNSTNLPRGYGRQASRASNLAPITIMLAGLVGRRIVADLHMLSLNMLSGQRAILGWLFLAVLSVAPNGCRRQEAVNPAADREVEEAFFSVRDEYFEITGQNKDNAARANKALRKLAAVTAKTFLADAWYLAVDICLRHAEETHAACKRLIDEAAIDSGSATQVMHLVIGQTAIATNPRLWQTTTTQREFCSHISIKNLLADSRYRKNNALLLTVAMQDFCRGEKSKADEKLRQAYGEYKGGNDTHLEIMRRLIIGLALGNHLGLREMLEYLTYSTALKHRDYTTLGPLRDTTNNFVVRKIFFAEIINPYDALAPYADKNSASKVRAITREITASVRGCKSFACDYLLSESLRLAGEMYFVEGNFAAALDAGERCLALVKQKPGCLSLILATGLSLGRPEIRQKYSAALEEQLPHSFLFREHEHAAENSAFKPGSGSVGTGEVLEKHRVTRLARNILAKIRNSPYLRGRVTTDIQVTAVDYDNAEVFSAGGKAEIFLGVRLIDRVLKKINSSAYRSDLTESDIVAAILGHEVHHIVAGDPLFHCSLKYSPGLFGSSKKFTDNRSERESKRADSWRREYNADEMGALYAFLTGHRAGALLHVLADWAQKEPVMKYYAAGGGDPHPPHLMRVDALSSKIQILQTVANAFRNAEEHLEAAEKLAKNHNARQNARIARHLEQADYGLDWVAAKLPGHEALVNNRAVVKIHRALLEEPAPEVPVFPHILSRVEFVPPVSPIAKGEIKKFAGDDSVPEENPSMYIYRFRPSLHMPLQNAGVAKQNLKMALDMLGAGHRLYPGNRAIMYNLSLCHYLLAQLEVRKYHIRKRKNHNAELSLNDGAMGMHLQTALDLLLGRTRDAVSRNLQIAIAIAHQYARESTFLKPEQQYYCRVLRADIGGSFDCRDIEAAGQNQVAVQGLFAELPKTQNLFRFTLFQLLLARNAEELYRGNADMTRLVEIIHTNYLAQLPPFWRNESEGVMKKRFVRKQRIAEKEENQNAKKN